MRVRWRKPILILSLTLIFATTTILAEGNVKTASAQVAEAVGTIAGLAVFCWMVGGIGFGIYYGIRAVYRSTTTCSVAFVCPKGLRINGEEGEDSSGPRIKIHPKEAAGFLLTDQEAGDFWVSLNFLANPLRGHPVYDVCLSQEMLRTLKAGEKKEIQVQAENGPSLFTLGLTRYAEQDGL